VWGYHAESQKIKLTGKNIKTLFQTDNFNEIFQFDHTSSTYQQGDLCNYDTAAAQLFPFRFLQGTEWFLVYIIETVRSSPSVPTNEDALKL